MQRKLLHRRCDNCSSYLASILKFLVSHIGLVSLVVGYTILGAFAFARLEAAREVEVKTGMRRVRRDVSLQLWNMTTNMRMLDGDAWKGQARVTLREFEHALIRAIKQDGWDGSEAQEPKQWTFAGALFYSIILITTIGYGHIAPKTPWGKVVTIFYAIPGVPLMMLCLANIGDGMAHSFRFLYWKVCCYACTKRPKRRRRRTASQRSLRGRPPSLRRSGRGSQRSGASRYSDPLYGGPRGHFEDGYLDEVERGGRREGRYSQRGSERGSGGLRVEDDCRPAVLHNRYAVEREGGGDSPPRTPRLTPRGTPRGTPRTSASDRDFRNPRDDGLSDPEYPIYRESRTLDRDSRDLRVSDLDHGGMRGSRRSASQGRDGRDRSYAHLARSYTAPPSPGRRPYTPSPRSHRYDPVPYIEDDYTSDEDEGEPGDKPVPIWLGVMLVVVYILGGAVLFSEWEQWDFLDSVYFCFITLTTIGFGDFVPAQEKKANAELSIALCSLYLLFGIALLAMSFNLVQEEVINNVKSVAKRLGIIKEEPDQLQD